MVQKHAELEKLEALSRRAMADSALFEVRLAHKVRFQSLEFEFELISMDCPLIHCLCL